MNLKEIQAELKEKDGWEYLNKKIYGHRFRKSFFECLESLHVYFDDFSDLDEFDEFSEAEIDLELVILKVGDFYQVRIGESAPSFKHYVWYYFCLEKDEIDLDNVINQSKKIANIIFEEIEAEREYFLQIERGNYHSSLLNTLPYR